MMVIYLPVPLKLRLYRKTKTKDFCSKISCPRGLTRCTPSSISTQSAGLSRLHIVDNYVKFSDSHTVEGVTHHSVNSSSHSVNGDIAIPWEWSNFDPSQNQNPLTDYDKTLHN